MTSDSIEETIRKLAGPLEVEARKGYRDVAVIGQSISEYALGWAERAARAAQEGARQRCLEIGEALADYARCDAEGRRARVERALRMLAQLQGAASAASPSRPGARAAQRRAVAKEKAVGAALNPLDAPLAGGRKPLPAWAKRLAKMGIATGRDLLYHFPRDYLPLKRIAELVDGERAAVVVEALAREESVVRERRGHRLMRYALEVSDGTGRAWVTSFARVPRMGPRAKAIAGSPLTLSFSPGRRVLIEGSVKRAGDHIEIQFSGSERADGGERFEAGRLVPAYPLSEGVHQSQVRPVARRLIEALPEDLPDPVPDSLRRRHSLPPLRAALRQMHWPGSQEEQRAAARRLAFEELLSLQIALAQRKRELQQPGRGLQMPPRGDVVAMLEEVLPFSLTRAQQRAIAEIAADMAADVPMLRLLQGDVGSGKTVVAAAALMIALQNGYQGALMAPTELLAEQHYLVLSRLLEPVGVAVELLTGSLRNQERERAYRSITRGRAQIAIGTHALIQETVEFHRLGLVIVDEQHRFGVRQRAQLRTKGAQPDTLVMTATPIPRTLALTLYGDLEISILDEMPPGRRPVTTLWFSSRRPRAAYDFVRQQVAQGRQAYVVCPLVEQSESLQAEAATRLSEELQREVFPEFRVGLVHGAMRVAEKDAAMEAFRAGDIDILTATTVIEVGVDVPNATVMLVINAERFGLAQLHQLRGRVGRGAHDSYCLLLSDQRYDPSGRLRPGLEESLEGARRRLKVLLEESDGFKIAEEDLLLRGPGEFYGTRQHGLPDFRLARMARELGVLEEAREAAFWLVGEDPALEAPEHRALREQVAALRARMDSMAG
jgi:ATP-dependent DNA helicase RecG